MKRLYPAHRPDPGRDLAQVGFLGAASGMVEVPALEQREAVGAEHAAQLLARLDQDFGEGGFAQDLSGDYVLGAAQPQPLAVILGLLP